MVVRNIAVNGMSGGVGHIGMMTQGYGGIYIHPSVPRISFVLSFLKRGLGIETKKRRTLISTEKRGTDIELQKRGTDIELKKRRTEIEFKKEE